MAHFTLSYPMDPSILPRDVEIPDVALHSAETAAKYLRTENIIGGRIKSIASGKGGTWIETTVSMYLLERKR